MPVPAQYLQGKVDQFVPPDIISGWVRALGPGHGARVTVSVHREGRLVGESGLILNRPDINPDEPAGFRISCTENIPDEQIAFDLLRIEARDDEGRSVALPVWDEVRSSALARLLNSTVPFGPASAAVILDSIGHSRQIEEQARAAILALRDQYFEMQKSTKAR